MFVFIGQALFGWLIADLLGGIVHWWMDRVALPRWVWLEKYVWGPNRVHHDDPMLFTTYGFWYRNSTTLLAAGLVGLFTLWLWGPSVVLLFAAAGGMLQNEIHFWTHRKQGGWIGVFQQVGIIQSVSGHARHHKPPQDRNYCVLTDFLNPVLEHFRVWYRIECILRVRTSDIPG